MFQTSDSPKCPPKVIDVLEIMIVKGSIYIRPAQG